MQWNPQAPRSLQTYTEHTHCVYSTSWSPYNPTMLLSGSGDQTVKIWDTKAPRSVQTLRAHNNEILSVDWNKYQDGVFVTGSVDRTVKVWDMRRPDREVVCLAGHEYAVRRVRCSPHRGNIVASAGYDMSVRFWDTAAPPGNNLIEVHDAHTEFVLGIDFNLYVEGQVATCAWDENVHVFIPMALRHRWKLFLVIIEQHIVTLYKNMSWNTYRSRTHQLQKKDDNSFFSELCTRKTSAEKEDQIGNVKF